MNLNNAIDIDLKHFFHWWWRELTACLPEKVQHTLSDQSNYIFLSISAKKLQFTQIVAEQTHPLTELPLNINSAASYQQLVEKHPQLEKAHYILRLNSDQAIKKIIYLPAAAKENLRQVVTFEMDKYVPFTAEQVYFALKPLESEDNNLQKLLLIVTPREKLEMLYQQLKNAGIYPEAVDFEQAPNDFNANLEPYNLLPQKYRLGKNKTTQWVIASLAIMLLILTAAALVYPVWHEGQTVKSLRQQLNKLEKDSRLVQSRQLEIDQLVDKTRQLTTTKNNAPSMVLLMNTLSQLIPNDTWLTHLRYFNGKLQIQGQSPAASALIGVLEAASLFSNVRFVSPLTQDKRTGMERFQISMTVQLPSRSDVQE